MGIAYARVALGLVGLVLGANAVGCTVRTMDVPTFDTGTHHDAGTDAAIVRDVGTDTFEDAGTDAPPRDAFLTLDAACTGATNSASLVRRPADIIMVVDNSNSMATAITGVRNGINDFASQLAMSDLDYRVIMLSTRGTDAQSICVPPPLAGDACADSERFFQIDVNIHSTTPIEQILGTLAQSDGYAMGQAPYGGPPWRSLLRDGATRTFVLVSDDNQRTCGRVPSDGGTFDDGGVATAADAGPVSACTYPSNPPLTEMSLEDFPGGGNPFSSRTIGPGILTATYGDLFAGYTFDAVYAYTDATGTCPPGHVGNTYTSLVARTHGIRRQICEGAAAFPPFFDAIAASVVSGSPISCTVDIPPPPDGQMLVVGLVNVLIRGTSGSHYVGNVASLAACDATHGGWYYDDVAHPTQILLCPTSCTDAQAQIVGPESGLDVQFGCQSMLM